ncbi:MrcB family domain-containing protein [Burkholderia pseudomallei]|uniref:MrcB family domain-containing protein n=1 Tax=Burkholderia pseudomallei TaxID=28450 RepID=UPI000A1A244D|nr:DUF3578 domain-containing protein [Burkholderia pseudomallei]ARL94671.1 hypothetical protein BOC58_16530 [Burkholderia pseudomallei]
MKSVIKRICELQPKYSSSNTTEMQERGNLIRSGLVQEIRARLPELSRAFDPLFDDLAVEGSDGIGRKTEAPWVRLYSKTMSPTPREGFYVVIHFSADGSACFFTVGCGSTIWSGGDLRPISDVQLNAKTSWARSVIEQRWETLAPFPDTIALGARASLPKTFEKATVVARRIPVGSIGTSDLDGLLFSAAERLSAIYLAQCDQRDVAPGDQDARDLATIIRPLRPRTRAQGLGLTAPERKAVELRAMHLATQFLQSQGFVCDDKSAVESFDILARRDGQALKVEVKGTTSELCDSILMTRSEVELHRREKGATGLLIVSRIRLDRSGTTPSASGGVVEALMQWDIDQWMLESIAFQVRRPS